MFYRSVVQYGTSTIYEGKTGILDENFVHVNLKYKD